MFNSINNKLQTTLYKTDRLPIYSQVNSELPRSSKENITYSQALRDKRICSTNSEFEAHINTIKDPFVNMNTRRF